MSSIILDYELEEWIRSGKLPGGPKSGHTLTWQHRVQYAVSHAINDFFTLEPHVRQNTPIQTLLNHRWPKKKDVFRDSLHYWEVYNDIVAELARYSAALVPDNPIMLYEQQQAKVSELDFELSMIFQAVWLLPQQAGGVKLQKFIIEDNPELVRAFLHMSHVFWNSVYGYPPAEIEILVLLTGQKYTYTQETLNIRESLDYLYLLSETVKLQKKQMEEQIPVAGKKTETPAYEGWRTGSGWNFS